MVLLVVEEWASWEALGLVVAGVVQLAVVTCSGKRVFYCYFVFLKWWMILENGRHLFAKYTGTGSIPPLTKFDPSFLLSTLPVMMCLS